MTASNVTPKTHRGTCLCGTLQYEIDGLLGMTIHCHCSMCRKHHGSSFATFVTAPSAGFRWLSGADQVVSYASSEHGQRSFCRHCGSVAPFVFEPMSLVFCPAGNLQGDLEVRPSAHFFVGSKAPWYDITDALPQHEEYPKELGTPGISRPRVEPREGIVEGSCLCGEVAYEITGTPIRMVNCHCSRCRRARSSAHATNIVYKIDAVRFTRGETKVQLCKAPEAQYFAAAFCQRCGGNVPRLCGDRGLAIVPAGSLDTDPGVRPQGHIFVGSKANWFEITDSIPQYPAGPPA